VMEQTSGDAQTLYVISQKSLDVTCDV
jgi:hypothetical protein